MSAAQDRLPGAAARRKQGRVRRALDKWIAGLRAANQLDAFGEALVPELRTIADKLDQDNDDPNVSSFAHTAAAARYVDLLEKLRPPPSPMTAWLDADDPVAALTE